VIKSGRREKLMNNETYLDFCFIRTEVGNFAKDINSMLTSLFEGVRLNWYLEEKTVEGAEMVVAEVKGMSNWSSEEETVQFLEENAGEVFWQYLQGYKFFIYPAAMRGCTSCETF
jgi:hypothetical protein